MYIKPTLNTACRSISRHFGFVSGLFASEMSIMGRLSNAERGILARFLTLSTQYKFVGSLFHFFAWLRTVSGVFSRSSRELPVGFSGPSFRFQPPCHRGVKRRGISTGSFRSAIGLRNQISSTCGLGIRSKTQGQYSPNLKQPWSRSQSIARSTCGPFLCRLLNDSHHIVPTR